MTEGRASTGPARRASGRRHPIAAIAAGVALLVVAASCSGSGADTASPMGCGASGTFRYERRDGVPEDLLSLDVWTPPADGTDRCEGRPLVVWVHGGGWAGGDKSEFMADKVPLFTGAGYVFASINYRLTDTSASPPRDQYPVHDEDAAAAVAWLVENAEALGVDTGRVAVLGHSAGGGITAAIATDERYLGAHDLDLHAIRCAASMDGEGYDVTAGATTAPVDWQPIYTNAFGTDPAVWAEASPITHISADKGIPDWFVAARGTEWRLEQHLAFIARLRDAGVPVTVLDSRQLEHADLTVDVGAPGDTVVTPALMAFLTGCFAG